MALNDAPHTESKDRASIELVPSPKRYFEGVTYSFEPSTKKFFLINHRDQPVRIVVPELEEEFFIGVDSSQELDFSRCNKEEVTKLLTYFLAHMKILPCEKKPEPQAIQAVVDFVLNALKNLCFGQREHAMLRKKIP